MALEPISGPLLGLAFRMKLVLQLGHVQLLGQLAYFRPRIGTQADQVMKSRIWCELDVQPSPLK